MRRIFNALLLIIAFVCAMNSWQYYIGVRVLIYDLILLIFIALYLACISLGMRKHGSYIPILKPLKALWIIFILSSFSIIPIIFRLLPGSLEQFIKGWLNISLWVTGFYAIVSYMRMADTDFARKLLKAYIIGVVVSCIFSGFEVMYAVQGIDINKIIFGSISTYDPGQFDKDEVFFYKWADFFRAVGFAGVNAQATYVMSAIPLLLYGNIFQAKATNYIMAGICIIGLGLTLSRTGLVALIVAVIMYCIICGNRKRFYRWLSEIIIIISPLVILAIVFPQELSNLIDSRSFGGSIENIGSGRREIYWETFKYVIRHPFGEGINQFSVVTANTDFIDFTTIEALFPNRPSWQVRKDYANVHNSWLNILFEGGWLLLSAYIAYYWSIIKICWISRSNIGIAGICSICGLLVSGLTNNTLDQFSVQLFFILILVVVVKERAYPSNYKILYPRTSKSTSHFKINASK